MLLMTMKGTEGETEEKGGGREMEMMTISKSIHLKFSKTLHRGGSYEAFDHRHRPYQSVEQQIQDAHKHARIPFLVLRDRDAGN
jgi:hypothetical protein